MCLLPSFFQYSHIPLLRLLIRYVEDPNEPTWKGYFYVAAISVISLCTSLFVNQFYFRVQRVGMHIRAVLVSAVYTKALRLSNSVRRNKTMGEIVNLMAVDVQRFMDMIPYLIMLQSAPLQVCKEIAISATLFLSILKSIRELGGRNLLTKYI